MQLQGRTGVGRDNQPLLWLNIISPDYFRAMNIPIRAGRSFFEADLPGNPPVAIVTAATAKRLWPNEHALGKHIKLVGQDEWHTVVGVAADVRAFTLRQDEPDWIDGTVYVPYGPKAILENGHTPVALTLVVRTALRDARTLAGALRQTVASVNADTTVSELQTLAAVVSQSVSTPRSTTSLFIVFAALALTLGMTGIYGVLSFFVSKRAREIGIRVALGAQRADVLRLVLREGAVSAAAGIVLGLTGALAVTRLMASELYGVSPADPLVFGLVAALVFAVTLLACYVPARRAMRVDPLIALRAE